MAAAPEKIFEDLVETLLCCKICLKPFDLERIVPRVLPCHHTFCGPCIHNLDKEGNLCCPNCRRPIQVTGAFPVDITHSALLEYKQAVKTQQEAPCEGCDDGSRATSRCLDCAQYFCEGCCKVHRNMKLARDHVMVSLSEAARSPSTVVQKVEMCQKHKEEKLTFYCKTCCIAICSTCAIILHKDRDGHNIVALDEVLDQTKREVESLCRELDEIRETNFQPRAKLASSCVEEMDATFKEAAREIQEGFGRLMKAVLERKDLAMEALKAKVKVERLELEEQAAETDSLESGAKTCTALGRTVASVGLPSHVLAQKQELERAVQEARAQVGKPLKASPRYKVAMDRSGLLKSLQQLGNVVTTKSSTQKRSREKRGSIESGLAVRRKTYKQTTSKQSRQSADSVTPSSSGASATSSVTPAVSDVTMQMTTKSSTQKRSREKRGSIESGLAVRRKTSKQTTSKQSRQSADSVTPSSSGASATSSVTPAVSDVTMQMTTKSSTQKRSREKRGSIESGLAVRRKTSKQTTSKQSRQSADSVTPSSSGASATSSVTPAVSDVTIQTPVFQLERGRCGDGCTLEKDGRTLTSSTRGQSGGCGQSGPRPFAFRGTCGSVDLSQSDLYYWTVTVSVSCGVWLSSGTRLEVGMASMQTLDTCGGKERISDHDVNAPTVVVVEDGGGYRLEGRCWTRDLDTPQPPVNRDAPYTCLEKTGGSYLEMTLGFLYDNRQPQSPCLFLVETQSSRLLGVRRLPPSQPLLPVFRVLTHDLDMASLELKTGPGILFDVTASLLQSLLGWRQRQDRR